MFRFLVTICIAMVGHLSVAVPLESPTSDDALFSAMHLESLSPDKVLPSAMLLESSLSDDALFSAMHLESLSPDKVLPSAMLLESSLSDDALFSPMHLENLSPDKVLPSAMLLESSLSDDALSSAMHLENLSPAKVLPSAMLQESSLSDDAPSTAMLVDSSSSTLLQESSSPDLSQYFDSRIIGGIDAPPGYAPHMVALVVGWQWKSFTCGGSIISCKVIVTAAHCVPLDWSGNVIESFHAIVGTNTWNHGGTIMKIKSYVNHPHYNAAAIKNDISLLITTVKLEFGKNIRPISLEYNWVDGGVKCHVTGWGTQTLWGAVPTKLQVLFIQTISSKICKKMIQEIAGSGWGPAVDFELEICTFHSIGHGMCHGDSGSALMDSETGNQIGIVSWGWPCAVGAPDIFVRISSMLSFIQSVIGNHHCKK